MWTRGWVGGPTGQNWHPPLKKIPPSGMDLTPRPFLSMATERPIEMRATNLYLANRWTEFEMLSTPHRFLYLVMFSLGGIHLVITQKNRPFLTPSPPFYASITQWLDPPSIMNYALPYPPLHHGFYYCLPHES